VALKTGTASGMSDLSAIVVSSECTVAAWSGRFDGAPTHGLSGMWGALPLARRVLSAATSGKDLSLSMSDLERGPASDPDAGSSPALEAWAERARTQLSARKHAR
jgi:membrane carboxypeptidase/penicillin-binding protein PbpC